MKDFLRSALRVLVKERNHLQESNGDSKWEWWSRLNMSSQHSSGRSLGHVLLQNDWKDQSL